MAEQEVKDVATEDKVEEKVEEESPGAHEETVNLEESSTESTEQQTKSGEDEKTQDENKGSEEVKDDGRPIPFERFSQVNTQKKEALGEVETLKTELEGMREQLQNPEVLRAVLKSQGLTDAAIDGKLKEAGHEVKEQEALPDLFKEMSKGEDLGTQQGWFNTFAKLSQHFSGKAVEPITQRLSDKDLDERVAVMETEAKDLAKELGIEYGESRKTENDPNTAIGKISSYLNKHPEDAGLGHAKLLRLALSEEGFKGAEAKGEQKEKTRNQDLKDSQMETEAPTGKGKEITGDSSIQEIMEHARTVVK